MTTIFRPGNRVVALGGGVEVLQSRSSGAVNWWEAGGATGAVAVYQPKGAASYAASKVNLANPGTYDATEGNTPSWASGTGWTFDGSTDYLNTGLILTTGASALVQFSNAHATPASRFVFGAYNASAVRFFIVPNSTGPDVWYRSGASYSVAPGLLTGNLGIAHTKAYRNGVAEAGTMPGLSGPTIYTIYVGAGNNGGPAFYFSGDVLAAAFYSSTLTAPQMAAVSAAMAAL